MYTAHDIAAYIIQKCGPMSAMKLQKLVYYAQAWSLVWDERPLFSEPIQAWANGPVIAELYQVHRGQFMVEDWPKGDPDRLDTMAIETIDSVIHFYGGKSAQWLSDLTHAEDPWKKARSGVAPGEPSSNEISIGSMHEYYAGL